MNQRSKACVTVVLLALLSLPEPAAAAGQVEKSVPLGALASHSAAEEPAARTRVSTQIFINSSELQRSGESTADEGLAMELKRFYINVDHAFSENWSGHLTTDVQWPRNSDPTDLFFRHAYMQRRLGQSHHLQLGNSPTPWIQRVAQLNGFRYVGPGLLPRMKMGAAADWGVQLGGDVGQFNYALAAVTGAGFRKPRLGARADIEARLSWRPSKQLEFAVGGYHGTRAMDVNDAPHLHTAERWTAMASYVDQRFRLGAEFFYADNWTRVTMPTPDSARGWSIWGSYELTPAFAAFARHDRTGMSLRLDPTREERFNQLGLEWKQSRHLRVSLVGKRTELTSASRRAKSNEVGIWGQLMY